MLRDMNLVRAVLREVEHRSSLDASGALKIEGYDDHTVQYHTRLVFEAGLIHADEIRSDLQTDLRPLGLTVQGQSFVEITREDAVWNRVMERVESFVHWIPFDMFQAMLANEAVATLGTEHCPGALSDTEAKRIDKSALPLSHPPCY